MNIYNNGATSQLTRKPDCNWTSFPWLEERRGISKLQTANSCWILSCLKYRVRGPRFWETLYKSSVRLPCSIPCNPKQKELNLDSWMSSLNLHYSKVLLCAKTSSLGWFLQQYQWSLLSGLSQVKVNVKNDSFEEHLNEVATYRSSSFMKKGLGRIWRGFHLLSKMTPSMAEL